MSRGKNKINIFEYRDYRAYLRDWYEHAKESVESYSYRRFAKKAGFKTSNFLMLVIQGKRNLTEDSLKKVIVGLGLNKQEEDFFRGLVHMNQAKSHEDQNYYYQRLLRSKKISQLKPIEKKQYEYYSDWYHPVVRELVVAKNFDGSPEWIAERLFPKVTPAQVSKSIELLEQLGFIMKDGDKSWRQASSIVSTGPELHSVVVHNYHKVLLELSKQMMDLLSLQYRDVSTMTLGIKKDRIKELRTKIKDFRQEILKMVSEDAEPEEVVQLNIQFYPVTKTSDGDKG